MVNIRYHNEYRKGDVSKIEGNGWSHFAENGKLSLSGEQDFDVLWKNKSLGKFVEHKEYDSYTAINAKMTSFTMEATFKGKNAEVFMNGQGYELVPSKVLVENHEIIYSSVETGSVVLNLKIYNKQQQHPPVQAFKHIPGSNPCTSPVQTDPV